jgi:hydrogenase-4 component F
MLNLIAIAVISVPFIITALFYVMGKRGMGSDNRFLNAFAVFQAVLYLCLALYAAACIELPVSILENGYFYIDSLALFEISLTSFVFLLAAVYARGYISSLVETGEIDISMLRYFYVSFCFLELVMVLAFSSNNLALLWIFTELSTILSAALIVTLKARENIIAALKYIFVASTAMLFSFAGIIILYAVSRSVIDGGSLNWSELFLSASLMNPRLFFFAFVFLFLGFAAKAGVAPFHTWVPTAYVRAPSVVAVVSGTVLNLGLYAIIRLYAIGYAAGAARQLGIFLSVFGIFSIGIAAFSMLQRTNTKKVIAFSGVESAGLLLIAVGLGSAVSLYWALFYTLGYTLVKSMLFFCAGIFHRQYKSNKFSEVRDAFKLQPLASWGLILGSAAAVGTPLFPVFLAKWNILGEMSRQSAPLLAASILLLTLAAIGTARFFISVFSRGPDGEITLFRTPVSMKLPVIVVLAILFILGLYIPGCLNDFLGGITSALGM